MCVETNGKLSGSAHKTIYIFVRLFLFSSLVCEDVLLHDDEQREEKKRHRTRERERRERAIDRAKERKIR